MSVYTEPRPTTHHDTLEVTLHGQSVELNTADHMDESSDINLLMQGNGILGKPIVDIEAGRQRFARHGSRSD